MIGQPVALDRTRIAEGVRRLATRIADRLEHPLIVPLAPDCEVFARALTLALGRPRELQPELAARDVVVAVTALDTGLRLHSRLHALAKHAPASVHACVLLDRPRRRLAHDLPVIASAFAVGDVLFTGYGLGAAALAPDLHFANGIEQARAAQGERVLLDRAGVDGANANPASCEEIFSQFPVFHHLRA